MTSQDFVDLVYAEKTDLLKSYSENGQTAVSEKLRKLNLTQGQLEGVHQVLDIALTDAYYTILLGLDGCAQLGGKQVSYNLRDEEGNVLSGGDLEAAAYERFHGSKS